VTIEENEHAFDKHQLALVREISQIVSREVRNGGISGDQAADLTEKLTFQIATLIDGDLSLELEGQPLVPVLTFAMNEERTLLLGNPGGSWMHEYALGAAESAFSVLWDR
jgi:hypothetical protein